VLKLAESFDLGAVMGDLGRIAQAAGNGAPAFGFKGIKRIGATANLLTVFEDSFHELFSDRTATDLIEIFDLAEELAAAGVELGGGG
jgi:hypothetical protein